MVSRRIGAEDILTALGPGSAGQVLTADGVGVPEWQTPTTGSPLVDLGNVSGDLSIRVTGSRVYKGVLVGNVTSLALTLNGSGYGGALIFLTQGGSGGNGIVFPQAFRWQGGFSPSLSTSVGATDVIQALTIDGGATWLAAIVLQAAP